MENRRFGKTTIMGNQVVKMFNERGIEISVPASLKADAKQEFEDTMNSRNRGATKEYRSSTRQNHTRHLVTLQEGLKRF